MAISVKEKVKSFLKDRIVGRLIVVGVLIGSGVGVSAVTVEMGVHVWCLAVGGCV